MSPTLAMFEPMTLPTAIASAPFKEAVRVAANSGALVAERNHRQADDQGAELKAEGRGSRQTSPAVRRRRRAGRYLEG